MPRLISLSATLALLLAAAGPAAAQTPNTATVVVVVTDQTGAVQQGAAVTATNVATNISRQATSGADGIATISALPVMGTYVILARKTGFADGTAANIALRAGETATITIKLVASGTSEVTVYGTATGVRTDPEQGQVLTSARIEQTPIIGRKLSALPLLNSSFRPAKGTGDLFINSVYFVAGAGGRREVDFVVDGATGNEPWGRQTMFSTLPIVAVEEMNVQSLAFSPEFGWTSMAAINVVTKSGTNNFHGEELFMNRPGGLQPKTMSSSEQCPSSISTCVAPTTNGTPNPIVPPDIPDSLNQGSFSVGGPLVKDKTFFFVSADVTGQDRTASITTPLSPASTYVGDYRQALVDGRVDDKLSATNTLMGRFNLDRFYDTNPQDAVSGTVLPSAGRVFTRHTYSGQINETAILSDHLLNEARIEYQDAPIITQFLPVDPSTQFKRAGSAPFTSGESRSVTVFSRNTQLSDTVTWTAGKHDVRFGGSLSRSVSGGNGTEFGSAYTLGQFTVSPNTTGTPDQLTLANMQSYTQSFNFGISNYTFTNWLVDGYAEDTYRVSNDLTLDLGLRYDHESFSDATKNFAPRVGFGWHPQGSPTLIVRGSYGIYYSELRTNYDADLTLGGPYGVFTYSATPGQTGFPTSLSATPVPYNQNSALSTLPARNITIRPGMRSYYTQAIGPAFNNIPDCPAGELASTSTPCYPSELVNPESQVASIGFEKQLAHNLTFSADYTRQHWTKLEGEYDLNAPSLFVRTTPGQTRSASAADATRPITPVNGGFRTINVLENVGVADYNGLQTTLRWQATRQNASVSYTLSKATDNIEPDGNGAGPNDFNQLGSTETGPSLLDQRHRVVVTYTYLLPHGISVGTVTDAASARPFNATTGVDDNGDGSRNDRPVINGQVVGRDAFRGTPTYEIDLFAEGKIPVGARSLVLRIEGFNVTNHANILGRNGTYGDGTTPLSTFGQASSGLANIEPGRMVQFIVKYVF